MRLTSFHRILGNLIAAWLIFCSSIVASQPAPKVDVAGGQDHPVIKRFSGSWLTGMRVDEFASLEFPTNPKVKERKLLDPVTVEGKITRLHYISPRGKTPLEVHRNYEQALVAAGYAQKFSCDIGACSDVYFALALDVNSIKWASGSIETPTGSRYSLTSGSTSEEARITYGTLSKGGNTIHVMVLTSVAAFKLTEQTSTVIHIAEPKAMQTNQVVVDTNAIKSNLESDGKIALYGIFFDTGKAVLKPESKPQLDEMAKLLLAQPNLKVYIVGHTDNQGSVDTNFSLSQQRAEAVALALLQSTKVLPARIVAKGVANFAPVASNISEAGRAKNRRVEMVVQ
jgi:OmpA-OmpF porin, OOP family